MGREKLKEGVYQGRTMDRDLPWGGEKEKGKMEKWDARDSLC